MKCLKEPLARLANHQDQTRIARFFEGRFKTIAILDEAKRCWRRARTSI